MKIKDYGYPVFRILNIWQVILFVSHNVKPIDCYVSVDSQDKKCLVHVFKREETEELLKKFKNRELEIGDHIISYDSK